MKKPLLSALSKRQTLILTTLIFGSVIFGVFFNLSKIQAQDEGEFYAIPIKQGATAPSNLKVYRIGDGGGTVVSNPAGINCGNDCSELYPLNRYVRLTATANSFSTFTGWSGDCTGTGPECFVVINKQKIVYATFQRNPLPSVPRILTVHTSGDGSGTVTSSPAGINCGNDCSGKDCLESYLICTQVTLTATPDGDSEFTGWSGDCTGTNPTCIDQVNANSDVTAEFRAKPPKRDYEYVSATNDNAKIQPANPADAQDNGQDGDSGDDIYFHSGEFHLDIVDLEIPSRGFNFRFSRSYKNQINYDGPLGYNWDFNYNTHIVQEKSGGIPTGNIFVLSGATRKDLYTINLGDGSYNTPAGFYNKLIKNPDNSFTLKERNGFKSNYQAFGPVLGGALVSQQDRNGNTMQFSYDAKGLLASVTDTVGRAINFYYYECGVNAGRLSKIRDFSGREVVYTYSTQGDLTEVRSPIVTGTPNGNDFPSGKITKYTYSTGYSDNNLNHNLITITNPNEMAQNPDGPAVIQNTYGTAGYTHDKVVRQDYGAGRFTYFYAELNPGADPNNLTIARNKTVAVDRMGNVTEYQHNIKGNRILLKEFTGRVNPLNPVLPPTGKVRASDPDYFTTTYVYNTHGQITRIVYPEGNVEEYTYNEASPDVFQKGNVLTKIIRPYLGASDTESIIKSYTYETNFNSVETLSDPKGNLTTYNYDPATGNLLSIQYPHITQPVSQDITESYTYNFYGQVLTQTEGESNVTEYQYYPGYGYLYKIISDPAGLNLTTEYTYDSVGNVSTIKDPKGNITAYNVNALNQVVKETSPAPVSEEKLYYYDANNNLVRSDIQNKNKDGVIDPANPWFTGTFAYNIFKKLTSKIEEVSLTKTVTALYEYDGNENLKRVTQPEGNKIFTSYDERDLVYQVTWGEGTAEASTTTNNYDGNENLKTYVDGRGKITTYNNDKFDRLTEIIDALGNNKTYVYDKASNVSQIKNEGPLNDSTLSNIRLDQTDFLHDEIDRLYQTSEAFFNPADQINYEDGYNTTTFFYNRNNRLYKETNDKDQSSFYYYDTADQLKKTVDAEGNEGEYAYDANSNITQRISREVSQLENPTQTYATTNVYDNLNRIIKKTDNLGQSEFYNYDSRNNLVYYTDKKGNTTSYTYDGLNRKLSTTYDLRDNGYGSGSVTDTILTTQVWDDNSRLISQTDDNDQTMSYQYDALNRLIRTTNADSTYYSYVMDANDNVTQITDPNGSVINNTYDDINRLTGKNTVHGPGVVGDYPYAYGYDGLSRMTRADVASGVIVNEAFSYDSLGSLRSESQGDYTTTSSYEVLGNRTQIGYPGGKTINLNSDDLNRVNNIADGSNPVSQLFYVGPSGRLEQKTNANNTQAVSSYDAGKRITDLIHENITPETTFAEFQYGYDETGNILYEKKIQSPWNGKGDVFNYDSVYQIKTAKLGVDDPVAESQVPGTGGNIQTKINYNLDGVGNRITVVTDDTTTVTYTSNNVNEYTTVGADSFTYDANGNITWDGQYQYQYFVNNQLARVRDAGDNLIASYFYDALGRRVRNFTYIPIPKYNHYYYDGQNLIEERDGTYSLTATYIYGEGVDEAIKMERGGDNYYYQKNALGSVTAITDSAGDVVEKYDYDPFGQVTILDGSDNILPESAIGNPLMFTGREYDKETSLYYYRNRNYNPEIGRFLQRDPIGTWTDAVNLGNGYSYVGNNPVNNLDPFGLWIIDWKNEVATAEPGDSLWSLSKLITGQGINWKTIPYKGNSKKLKPGKVVDIETLIDIKKKHDAEEARKKAEEERKKAEEARKKAEAEIPILIEKTNQEIDRLNEEIQKIEEDNRVLGSDWSEGDQYKSGGILDIVIGIIRAYISRGPTAANEKKWELQEKLHKSLDELKRLENMQSEIDKAKKAKEAQEKKSQSAKPKPLPDIDFTPYMEAMWMMGRNP